MWLHAERWPEVRDGSQTQGAIRRWGEVVGRVGEEVCAVLLRDEAECSSI